MKYQEIIVEQSEGLAKIILNRPNKLNALTPLMIKEWLAALSELSKDSNCKVIVVTGAGRAFSAGVDLEVFKTESVAPGFSMHEDGMDLMNLLETIPQVCIAMVNGFCFTGATELLMAFDLIIAADESKIGDTHSKWGILPKWGMTQRLAKHVGLLKAKELSFTAEPVSGKEAARIGLANKSVPLTDLEAETILWAKKIMKNSSQTIAAMKQMYNFGHQSTMAEGIQYELNYSADTSDKKEALNNFKKNF